jgi:hypothetical protein
VENKLESLFLAKVFRVSLIFEIKSEA